MCESWWHANQSRVRMWAPATAGAGAAIQDPRNRKVMEVRDSTLQELRLGS